VECRAPGGQSAAALSESRVVGSGEADFSALRCASVMRAKQRHHICFAAAHGGLL